VEPWRECADGVIVHVHVQPRARRTEVVGPVGGALKVRVTAPPERGRANEALVELLAGLVGVPKRDVAVVRGHTGRRKQVLVRGVTLAEVEARLGGTKGRR